MGSAVTTVLINALKHACVPGVCGILSFPAPPLAAVLGSALNSELSPQNRYFPPLVPFPQLQGVLPDILKPAVLPFPQINAFVLWVRCLVLPIGLLPLPPRSYSSF